MADLTGVSQGTISRWLDDKRPSPENAVEFARSAGGNPIEALVALGLLRAHELDKVVELKATADDLSNDQLVALVARRLGVAVIPTRGVRGA